MRNLQASAMPRALVPVLKKLIGYSVKWCTAAFMLAALSSVASAQQDQIINFGQLVVTGYSGATAAPPPQGADPFDYLGIKLDGPAARVVDVRVLGPQGQLSNVPKPFTVTASQVGQVFGVTLDNAPRPNIYVAATSAYGLAIAVLDENGQQKRMRTGAPGAQWMNGQFGPPSAGGGPGSIWKIDGTTGAVSLFANIPAAMRGAASLGALAFDPRTSQIFAVDRSSGVVHRFGLNGAQRGTYDHGTEGRGPMGLPPIPAPPVAPLNIGNPAFDTENPATWGFAAPARRVYALAVRGDRLYYSVAQGPQVWSAGISASGSVAASPRVEVEVPSLQEGVEIASITFDAQGRMYLAERGATTGDYFRYNLANGEGSRVLRYVRKLPGDPAPGLWQLTPEPYSIGLPPSYANAAGGVTMGFAYNQDNVIDFNSCGVTLWSTGERLLNPGEPAAPAGSFPNIDGLQANAIGLVQPQNTPPLQSWFVDYDDFDGDPNYRGHMGAVATLPCPGAPVATPPPPPPPTLPPPAPPPVTCPPGTYFANGQCLIVPTCPVGTYYANGKCFYKDCPPGYYLDNGQCKPPPVTCPPGTFYYQGQCFPIACPPGMIKQPNGQCKCPAGLVFFQGQCVPSTNCPPGLIELPGGICWCPLGTIFDDGLCQPNTCPPGQIWQDGFCKVCPNNKDFWNGQCVPKCPPGQVHLGPQGVCGPPPACPPGQELWNGQCKPKCPPGQVHQPPFGFCGPGGLAGDCPPGQEKWNGQCKPKCPPGQVHQPPFGFCGPGGLAGDCPPGQEKWNGQCKPKCPPGQVHQPPFGFCGPGGLAGDCPPGQEKWNGQCKPKCPPGQEHKPPFGFCGPIGPIGPGGPGGIIGACPAGQEVWNGKCEPKCAPGEMRLPNGMCFKQPDLKMPGLGDGDAPPAGPGVLPPPGAAPPAAPPGIACLPPLVRFNGTCVEPCKPNEMRLPNGLCIATPDLKIPGLGDVLPPPSPGGVLPPPPPSAGSPPQGLPQTPPSGPSPSSPPDNVVRPDQPPIQINPDLIEKLPEFIAPKPTEPPPSPPSSSAPPSTPPPPLSQPPVRVVPGAPPAVVTPAPTERTPPPPPQTSPPSASPPAAPQINLPGLLKGLQQLQKSKESGANGSSPSVKTAPNAVAEPEPVTPAPEATPQIIPGLNLQLQNLAPATR